MVVCGNVSDTSIRNVLLTILAASLQKAGTEYAKRNGGGFEVVAKVDGNDVKLTVTGVSAHSSEPQSGVNPNAGKLSGYPVL